MSFLSKPLCTIWALLLAFSTFNTSANQSVDNKEEQAPVAAQSTTAENNVPASNTADSAPVAEPVTDKPAAVTEAAEPKKIEPEQTESEQTEPVQSEPVAQPANTTDVSADVKQNEAASVPVVVTPASKELETSALSPVKFTLNSEEQKRAYASGVTLARYLQENMVQQQKLHITLDPQIVLAGIVDTFKKEIKMDDATIQKTMAAFDEQVNILNKAKFEQESRHELEIGNAYQDDFAKQDGVKKSKSGLLYLITTKGSGAAIKETDTVEIELIGTLVNGTEFEKTTKPITLKVSDVIPALRSGIKLAGKGGEVKLVVPPEQGYGAKGALPGIPPNATLIFQIKVLQVGSGKSK